MNRRGMLNIHEEKKCSAFEIVVILIATIAAVVTMAVVLDVAMDKTEEITRARLDRHLTPPQRAKIMRGHQ